MIQSFPFEDLFNLKREASSSLGYKHTKKAIEKMKLRFLDKTKHPMFGKKHNLFALQRISKPGKLNPMFGKTHSIKSRKQISISHSKIPLGLYDLNNNNLLNSFLNQVELAKYLSLSKSTIGRYVKSNKILLNKYKIRPI